MYRQVHLKKETEFVTLSETVWIPIKFAVKGIILKIKRNGIWDDGWEVTSVYSISDAPQTRRHLFGSIEYA